MIPNILHGKFLQILAIFNGGILTNFTCKEPTNTEKSKLNQPKMTGLGLLLFVIVVVADDLYAKLAIIRSLMSSNINKNTRRK